jgi:hypothetical protein
MLESGSVVIQGAKCTVFSDAFFHKLKQELTMCKSTSAENLVSLDTSSQNHK